MELTMEELVPVVGKLAEKYAAYEHTSISYEEARQLMEAVKYCIHEAEASGNQTAAASGNMTAQQLYEAGLLQVEEKAKKALALYNEIMPSFVHYGNRCLHDTVISGLPEFFKWYDMKFCPQDTILTLDYPVLKNLSGQTGIDKIYEFILCIRAEQKFLNTFPEAYVQGVLMKYDSRYEELAENLCWIVLRDIACHVMAKKPLTEHTFTKEDYRRIQSVWEQPKAREEKFTEEDYRRIQSVWEQPKAREEKEESGKTQNAWKQPKVQAAKEQVRKAIASLVQGYAEDAEEIVLYLEQALEDIFVRLGAVQK